MRLVTAAALAAALLVPSGAAKEPVSGSVCGAGGCVVLADPAAVHQALRWEGTFQLARAPRPAPFFRLTFFAAGPEGFRWAAVYVPSRRLLRVDDRGALPPEFGRSGRPYWRTLTRRQLRMLVSVTRGVEPFPASRGSTLPDSARAARRPPSRFDESAQRHQRVRLRIQRPLFMSLA